MEAAQIILNQTKLIEFVIQVGMLTAVIIGMQLNSKRITEKKIDSKADKCDMDKKVSKDIFDQHVINEKENFKLLIAEIRLNREAINDIKP